MAKPASSAAALLLRIAGSVAVLVGLIKPLVNIPVVGSEKYVTTTMGGWPLAWLIFGLLLLSSFLILFKNSWLGKLGWLLAGISWGLLAGTILSFHRWAVDVISQLGQGEELIRQSTYATGTWWIASGVVAWLVATALAAFCCTSKRR